VVYDNEKREGMESHYLSGEHGRKVRPSLTSGAGGRDVFSAAPRKKGSQAGCDWREKRKRGEYFSMCAKRSNNDGSSENMTRKFPKPEQGNKPNHHKKMPMHEKRGRKPEHYVETSERSLE